MITAGRIVGFIDLGTNSARLLIARLFPDRTYQVITRRKELVRLGEGEFTNGYLQPDAMDRAVLVCRRFVEIASAAGAQDIFAVATSATRDARNQTEFLHRLESENLPELHVISGKEEARLIYLGVSSGLRMVGKRGIFIDIGGGSTELIVGDQTSYQFLDSLDLGAIRLTVLFLPGKSGVVSSLEYAQIQEYILDAAVRAIQGARQYPFDLAVGSSGTIENLADIASHQFKGRKRAPEDTLKFSHLTAVVSALCSRTLEERRRLPGINPERADIIIAGAAVLHTLMQELQIGEIRISERGLQDGLLIDYLALTSSSPVRAGDHLRRGSVLRLGRSLGFDEAHSNWVAQLALQLFDTGRETGIHRFGPLERELLEFAALLHDIGVALSYNDHHRHSYYFIHNAGLLGFDQTEIDIIANTTLFHRKSNPNQRSPEFAALNKRAQQVVRCLCVLLGLAEGLDRSHMGAVEKVSLISAAGSRVTLEIQALHDPHLEVWGVEYHTKNFKKVFGKSLCVSILTNDELEGLQNKCYE